MKGLFAVCVICDQTINENVRRQALQSLEKTSVSSVVQVVFLLDNKSTSDLYFRGFAWGGYYPAYVFR
jgi:hypothetical protein